MSKPTILERIHRDSAKSEIEAYYRGVQDTLKEIGRRYAESPDSVPDVHMIIEEVLDEMIGGNGE